MTADLVARLEAEADLRDYVWTDTPTANPTSKPVYSARMRALLREAASALRSSGEAVAWLCENNGDTGATTLPSAVEYWRARGWKVAPLYLHPATPASAWRPIEEAPRDGRYVLLVHESSGGRPYAGMWCHDDKQWVDERGCIRVPTHFQPLPTPPTSTKGG